MQVLNQQNKNNKNLKSQLLLIGSLLIFVGVISLSHNHLEGLKEEIYDEMKIKFASDIEHVEEDIATPNIENIDQDTNPAVEKPKEINYNYLGYLEIPRIGLKKGFLNKSSRYNNVDYNIQVSSDASYPDVEKGNFIIMGHSGYAYNSYFAKLYKLKEGAIAKVTYKNKEYKYKLVKIEVQPKTGFVAIHRDNYDTKALTLITCTKDDDTTQTIYIFELT